MIDLVLGLEQAWDRVLRMVRSLSGCPRLGVALYRFAAWISERGRSTLRCVPLGKRTHATHRRAFSFHRTTARCRIVPPMQASWWEATFGWLRRPGLGGFRTGGSAAHLVAFGGDERDRTVDLLLAKQALYQLSYIPEEDFHSCTADGRCSAQSPPGTKPERRASNAWERRRIGRI
jgi:hypothetical protein